MTTCVPIKLGGVSTHRLVMRVMCWQPGKTGVLKKRINNRMSGFRESRLPPVTKPLIKVQKAGYFLGNSKNKKNVHFRTI